MKYETPELTALTPAINAIQSITNKTPEFPHDSEPLVNDAVAAYQDWE
jgi:hypothetical protein